MTQNSPTSFETVQWYHHAFAAPLRLLSSLNLGPLGGTQSISAVIEAVLAHEKGVPITFELTKSEKFFFKQMTKGDISDDLVEYRELNHAVQEEILRRWGDRSLGVIWLGAGVFTFEHPLLQNWKETDWHIWTDKSPKVVASALTKFQEMQERLGKLSRSITLPHEVDYLNEAIQFASQYVDHIIVFGYGVTYVLLAEENVQWLSQLQLPADKDVSFVFNAPPDSLIMPAGVMAAFHQQRMVHYNSAAIAELFAKTVPNAQIVWQILPEETRTKLWSTWLIHRPAE